MSSKKQKKMLTSEELSLFFRQLSLLLNAGIKPADSVSLLLQDSPSGREQMLLHQMQTCLDLGNPLSVALEGAGCFPSYAIHLSAVAEESGRMEQVLSVLADHYDREDDLQKNIRRVVTYPLLLAVIITAVTFVLVAKVLPAFQRVLGDLGTTTDILLRFGVYSKNAALVLAVLLLIGVLIIFTLSRTEEGVVRLRRGADRILLSGKLSRSVARERLASAMALRLASGADVEEALSSAKTLCEDEEMAKKMTACQERLEAGKSFSTAAGETGLFDGLSVGLLSAGFRSGAMDTVMQELSLRSHKETEALLERLLGRVEPMLILFLSLSVGLVLLSVMLPLMSMLAGIGA